MEKEVLVIAELVKKNSILKKQISILFLFCCIFSSVWAEKTDLRPDTIDSQQRLLDYYLNEAVRQRLLQYYDQSVDLLRFCYLINPQNATVLYELSNRYTTATKLGLQYAQMAVEADPKNILYRKNYADACFNNGQIDLAITQYEILSNTKSPSQDKYAYILLNIYNEKNEYQKCLDVLNQIENRNGPSAQYDLQRISIYEQMGNRKKAIEITKNLTKTYPYGFEYQVLLAELYLNDNNTKKAQQIIYNVLEKDPNNEQAHRSQLLIFLQQKKAVEADSTIYSIFENRNLSVDFKIELFDFYFTKYIENFSIALVEKSLATLLEQYPENERVNIRCALACANDFSKIDKQIEHWNVALQYNPQNVKVWATVIDLKQLVYLAKPSDTTYASLIKTCDEAIEANPEDSFLKYLKGTVLLLTGKKEQAFAIFEQVVQDENLSSEIKAKTLCSMADLLQAKNEIKEALLLYEQAYQLTPKDPFLLNNYAYCLALGKKDLAKAEQMSAIAIKAEPNNYAYLDTYAWIFFLQEEYTLAYMYIEQAIQKYNEQQHLSKDTETFATMNLHREEILKMLKQSRKTNSEK